MRRGIALVSVTLLLALPATAVAQARLTGADLDGTVIDQTEAVLLGAKIAVTNVETGITRTVLTDSRGYYHVPALPPGTYALTVTLAGFATQTHDHIVLLLGQLVTIDFTLTVAVVGQSVTVTAEIPLVHPGRSQAGTRHRR